MIEPQKWIAKSNTTWKKRLVVVGNRGAAERAFTLSQMEASVMTRFQPRRYTAQESSEVQPLKNDDFHRYHLCGQEYYLTSAVRNVYRLGQLS
jgi:hypothetical protein